MKHPKGFRVKMDGKVIYLYPRKYKKKDLEAFPEEKGTLVKLSAGYYYLSDPIISRYTRRVPSEEGKLKHKKIQKSTKISSVFTTFKY